MATMNISLPAEMKTWIEAQAANGSYANVSDYMRDIVRKEQERAAFTKYIEQAAKDGIASGFVPYSREEMERELGLTRADDAA